MYTLLFLLSLLACSAKEQEADATITRRERNANGTLMVTYQFKAEDRLVMDSMELAANLVLPHDSVKVIFSPANPSESRLKLPGN